MDRLLEEPGSVADLARFGLPSSDPLIGWLGQAGFLIGRGTLQLVIDPYLSDSLATKYRGTHFPHTRLMRPPIAPEQLTGVQVVLCTHAHTDHMDPETLPRIAEASPECLFVVPRAEEQVALQRGVPAARLLTIDAGELVACAGNLAVRALPAAHEQLETDAAGRHRYLGYLLYFGDEVVYHSGDCVPYPGLREQLTQAGVDLALLPVNGRNAERQANGVPGNFTWDEAVDFCLDCHIPAMLACHFGMFDFNTVDASRLDEQIAQLPSSLQCVRPREGYLYRLLPKSPAT
jgi:L-ascorbate metabolism protein UlaG (beta-lactamase superfamily)